MKLKKHEIIIMIVLGVVIVVAGIILFWIFHEYSTGQQVYEKMGEQYVFLPEDTPEPRQPGATNRPGTSQKDPSVQATEEPQATPFVDRRAPVVDFEGLKKQNEDILGWIYSPGTPINYPVVQGDTNEEYLYRTADRTANRCGSIFLDCQNDKSLADSNNVIHGHNMQNGSMFAEIMKYGEQKYYDEHPRIWLVTPDQTYSIELFAGFVTSSDSDVWKLTFAEEEDFTAWKSDMTRKSYFQSQVIPMAGEKVVTLSTCTYDFDGARFVVMGVLR